ncbi:MAG: AMP-binding protein [Pseudomonadota bacterium]
MAESFSPVSPTARGLAEAIALQARVRPDAVALRFEGEVLSYSALHTRVRQAAAIAWHGWGVRPGDRVAWLGGNHPGQLVLLFALAEIGAMLLPLNFRLAPAEWDAMVADVGAAHVVHDAEWADAARALAVRNGMAAHAVRELEQAAPVEQDVPRHGDVTSPVLLVYTSGTTGGPKAAVHTQGNLLAGMRIAAQVQGMHPGDRILTVLPMFHVGGLCIQTLPALGAGAEVILHPRFDAARTLADIRALRPTLTLQVPPTMKALAEHVDWAGTDLSCLRAVWAGSSLLPRALVEAFHACGVPVCNVYGATETGPFSIALPPARAFDHVDGCGWPAPEVEVMLDGADASSGEVWVRAPNVVQRYWPDIPACDAQGWFRTGDLARRHDDGSYAIVGRIKDLIISGGENIHPAEIENALAEHPAVAECAAFGLPDAQWGEVVAVAVVRNPGAQADEAVLAAYLAQRIARYKLPRRWVWMDALPKTALGKVQRKLLHDTVPRSP